MAKARGPPFSSRTRRASSSTHAQKPPVRPCAICTLSARTPASRRRPPSCEAAGLRAPASINPHIAADTPRRNADPRGEAFSLVVPKVFLLSRGVTGAQGGAEDALRQAKSPSPEKQERQTAVSYHVLVNSRCSATTLKTSS